MIQLISFWSNFHDFLNQNLPNQVVPCELLAKIKTNSSPPKILTRHHQPQLWLLKFNNEFARKKVTVSPNRKVHLPTTIFQGKNMLNFRGASFFPPTRKKTQNPTQTVSEV